MEKITLRYLEKSDKDQFMKANEANWDGFAFAHYWESLAEKNFDKYIRILPDFSKGLHIPKDHVACTFLFAFNESNELIGRTSIRHELTPNLLKIGGHIGYGVLPTHRKKGYATEILKESLQYIQKAIPKIKKVLVTCDEDNIGSQKTILKNNGELENILEIPGHPNKMRYWIHL